LDAIKGWMAEGFVKYIIVGIDNANKKEGF
jgi:hypothetical protein